MIFNVDKGVFGKEISAEWGQERRGRHRPAVSDWRRMRGKDGRDGVKVEVADEG